MKLIELLAAATPTEPDPRGQTLQMVGMFAIMGVMLYFVMIRPQQKQRKEQENMIKNVKTGDRILTTGGIFGIVTNVKDKSLMVKIADNVKIEITKGSVGNVVPKSTESEASDS